MYIHVHYWWLGILRLKDLSKKTKCESNKKGEKRKKRKGTKFGKFLCTKQKKKQNPHSPNSEICMKCLLLKTRPNQLQVWWNLVTTHLKMSTNTPNWKYSNTWSSLITIQKFLQTSNLNCFCDLWSKHLRIFFSTTPLTTQQGSQKTRLKMNQCEKKKQWKRLKNEGWKDKIQKTKEIQLFCIFAKTQGMGHSRNL